MTLFKAVAVAVIALASQSVFAQNLRPCTNEVLTCKLENAADFYHRTTLDTKSLAFSGLNDDEPSIQPNECKILAGLDNKSGRLYSVLLGDSDYMANIYVRSTSNMGSALPGSVSFVVVPGKTFYYEYDKEILTCTLK